MSAERHRADYRRDNRVKNIKGIQADGHGLGLHCRKFFKKRKNRSERRRANKDPECVRGYGKYNGWLS